MSHGDPSSSTRMFARLQIAVGDPVRAQARDLLPQRGQERVVDLGGVERIEPAPVDVVEREQHRVGADVRDGAHARGPHADVARL